MINLTRYREAISERKPNEVYKAFIARRCDLLWSLLFFLTLSALCEGI